MPRLIFTNPEFSNQSCQLPNGTFTVGRSRENDIVIRADSVSQTHCELLVYGPEVIVREKGSKNGTFVSGDRVNAQKGIRHGDCLQLGKVKIRLELERDEHDNSTAISAIQELGKIQNNQRDAKPIETKFPVIFKPKKNKSDSVETTTSLIPPLPVTPGKGEPAKHQNLHSASGEKGFKWKWLAASLVIAAALAYLIWK